MRIRKALVAVGILTGSALATTFAFAAWNASGSGQATVQGKTAQALTVSNVAISDALYPSATSGVKVSVTNPNPYPVTVTSIEGNGAITVDSLHSDCAASNVSFTNQTLASGVVLGANDGNATIETAGGVKMIANAADACQGATFTIPVKAVGASSAN